MGQAWTTGDGADVTLDATEVQLVGSVVLLAKDLEAFLSQHLGAPTNCRGLHEMITAVEPRLAGRATLVRQMRWLATMRNKAVHEAAFRLSAQVTVADFQRRCSEVKAALRDVLRAEAAAAASAAPVTPMGCVVS